ncbi:long-chain fatty-acid-CoA ligase [Candidatus Magnetoovum chiemensis]|nr:long-chain fatty-acid-CoA ligase [Candidatus Magnetoovum chiemensis]
MDDKFVTEAQIVYETAHSNPDKVRFMLPDDRGNWRAITWGAFYDKAQAISAYVSSIALDGGDKVAVFLKNMVEWAYISNAIHVYRAVFVPIYISSTAEQSKYVINHSDAKLLFTEMDKLDTILTILDDLPNLKHIIITDLENDAKLIEKVETYALSKRIDKKNALSRFISLSKVYDIGNEINIKRPHLYKTMIDKITLSDVSSLLYTSGTTGNPKGVVLTINNLYTNAKDWIDVLSPLIPETRIDLLWLPLSHIFGWGELGLGNTLGFTTYMTTHIDVLRVMPEVMPTIFISVPAYWEKLYLDAVASSNTKSSQLEKLRQLTGGALKFCLSGGAGLKKQVKDFFYDAGLLIIEGYGLTECSPTLTMNKKDDFNFDSVGKPFPNVSLKLDLDGEILAKGPNVFSQYYKDPLSTKEAFTDDGWFKTGDIGQFNNKGFLKIIGRKKEIIVTSGGKNISPQLIESKFKDDPYIEQAVLYGNERKYIVALIIVKENAIRNYAASIGIDKEQSLDDLLKTNEIISLIQQRIDNVNSELASFETIKKFYLYPSPLTIEGGFLTPSFKLKRNKVYDAFKEQLDSLYD